MGKKDTVPSLSSVGEQTLATESPRYESVIVMDAMKESFIVQQNSGQVVLKLLRHQYYLEGL